MSTVLVLTLNVDGCLIICLFIFLAVARLPVLLKKV